jgi:hypothetical protein
LKCNEIVKCQIGVIGIEGLEKRVEKESEKMGSNSGEEAMQGSTGSEERILVSVRVRPLNDKELARNDLSEWECINDTTIVYRSNLSASERSLYPTSYSFGMKSLILRIYM